MASQFHVGQVFHEQIAVDGDLIAKFAASSGDTNPIHIDADIARQHGFARPIAHGAILVSALSRLIGTRVPGPGALWLKQDVEWKTPVFAGDVITLSITISAFSEAIGVLELQMRAVNQAGQFVMTGSGSVKCSQQPMSTLKETAPPKQRVALITGGSRGIGATIAQNLAEAGWGIAVNYVRSSEAADAVLKSIETNGGKVHGFRADISDPEASKRLVSNAVHAFGRLDAIVHCATPPLTRGTIDTATYTDVEPFLRVYLGAAIALTSAAKPHMEAQRFGRFVFLGTSALFGVPPTGLSGYVAAKSALLGFARGAASELGPFGITVNMVSPGLTITDLTADISARAKELEARRVPVRRLATSQDTAALVGFLLRDDAGYINGAHIPISGGPV